MSQMNPEYVEIHPLKKGGRVLLHFCDLFLNFFLALFFFSVLLFPISRSAAGYDENEKKINDNQVRMVDVLFENQLLEKENEEDSFTSSLTYSGNQFVLSFLNHEKKHDYFYHYFVDIMKEENQTYLDFYKKNDKNGYFEISKDVFLKEEYQNLLSPLLDSKDTLSSKGETVYRRLINSIFPNFYSAMIEDILQNEKVDSSSPVYPYRAYKEENTKLEKTNRGILSVDCYISYALGCLIYFLLIPMLSRRGKTISMMALGYEKVGLDNLKVLKRKERILPFFFYFFFNLSLMIFLPMLFIEFATLFSIPGLLTCSLVGSVLSLISFVYLCFDSYGIGLSDRLTKTCYIKKGDLEKLATLKGYKVDHA